MRPFLSAYNRCESATRAPLYRPVAARATT
jgi:hypothetical protein